MSNDGALKPQNESRLLPIFNAYVDGYNLYYGILRKYPEFKWLDLIGWLEHQLPGYRLNQAIYFSSPIKESFPQDNAPRRQHTYWRVLKDSGVIIIEGKFRKDEKAYPFQGESLEKVSNPTLPNFLGSGSRKIRKLFKQTHPALPNALVSKMEEKRSDVNLAAYLLRDSYMSNIDGALIVTTDSDLAMPIQFAKEAGIYTKLIVPGQVNAIERLRASSHETERLKPDLLGAFQFPAPYKTKKNSLIFKPTEWN